MKRNKKSVYKVTFYYYFFFIDKNRVIGLFLIDIILVLNVQDLIY